MDLEIELEINSALVSTLKLPKRYGCYQLSIDIPLKFSSFKKQYLDIIFTHDDISMELLMFDEGKLDFRFFNKETGRYIQDDDILDRNNVVNFMKVYMNLKSDEIEYKSLLPLIQVNQENVLCVMVGCKIIQERNLKETYVFKNNPDIKINPKYGKYHDIFRQQLPLPILVKSLEIGNSLTLVLIDVGYDKPQIFSKIDCLKDISSETKDIITLYEEIPFQVLFKDLFNIETDVESTLEIIVIKKNINIKSSEEIIPYIQDRLYYLYLSSLSISKGAILTNDPNVDEILQWHGK